MSATCRRPVNIDPSRSTIHGDIFFSLLQVFRKRTNSCQTRVFLMCLTTLPHSFGDEVCRLYVVPSLSQEGDTYEQPEPTPRWVFCYNTINNLWGVKKWCFQLVCFLFFVSKKKNLTSNLNLTNTRLSFSLSHFFFAQAISLCTSSLPPHRYRTKKKRVGQSGEQNPPPSFDCTPRTQIHIAPFTMPKMESKCRLCQLMFPESELTWV